MFNTSILLNYNSTPSTRKKSLNEDSKFKIREHTNKQSNNTVVINHSSRADMWTTLTEPIDNGEPMSEAEKHYWENL